MKPRRVVVLDTNCLVQSISQRSNYYPVWKCFINGEYDLCVSSEILEEYEEVIGRLMSPLAAKIVVEAILKAPNTHRLDPHFRVLETIPFPSVCVIRLDEFLKEIT